jgi:hypothetical protein
MLGGYIKPDQTSFSVQWFDSFIDKMSDALKGYEMLSFS